MATAIYSLPFPFWQLILSITPLTFHFTCAAQSLHSVLPLLQVLMFIFASHLLKPRSFALCQTPWQWSSNLEEKPIMVSCNSGSSCPPSPHPIFSQVPFKNNALTNLTISTFCCFNSSRGPQWVHILSSNDKPLGMGIFPRRDITNRWFMAYCMNNVCIILHVYLLTYRLIRVKKKKHALNALGHWNN